MEYASIVGYIVQVTTVAYANTKCSLCDPYNSSYPGHSEVQSSPPRMTASMNCLALFRIHRSPRQEIAFFPSIAV